jgi:hypothetical protein
VTNAVAHAGTDELSIVLLRMEDPRAVALVVDSSPVPPVRRVPAGLAEHGHGLCLVDALSDRWGWVPRPAGKLVYAILTREA